MSHSSWATLPVCSFCWYERNPDREPPRRKAANPGLENCVVCRKPTGQGIYVRMQVVWDD